MIIIILAIIIGVGIGTFIPYTILPAYTQYMAIALLACFDTILGGLYAEMDQKFKMNVFITGFFSNALLAIGIIWIGGFIGVDLSIAAIVVFGTRIFNNFSKIRQKLLQRKEK